MYIEKTIRNCFNMWNKKRDVIIVSLFFISTSGYSFWVLKSRWHHCYEWHNILVLIKSLLYISRSFPTSILIPPFLCPLPPFIPGYTTCPGLDFTVWKPYRIVQPERPTSKLTTGCEGVTLASSFRLFFSLLFFPFLYCSILLDLHSGMLEWRGAQCADLHTCKPQSWLKTAKSHRPL